MANVNTSEYGKYVSLQNVSASADPSTVPAGGVYLFASGTAGSSKLYLQNEGSSSPIDVGDLSVDIDGFTAFSGVPHATEDEFLISDDGTEKRATMTMVANGAFALVSGDATIAAGGALTIAAQAVENSMLADDAVGADELAANAVVNASIASNAAIDMDKLDGGSLAGSLSDLAQGDLMYAGDVDDSSNLKSITFSNLEDAIFGNVSGDATIAAGGALTIAATSVENGMLAGSIANNKLANDSVTIGSTEIDLGATTGIIQGLTQLTASHIQVTNLDVVNVNSVSQTEQILEVHDKLIITSLSASSANSSGGGLKIGGGQSVTGHASILWDHGNSALDFNIGGTTEMRLADGVLRPQTNNDVDLGASGAEFKDLYLDGSAIIDALIMPDVTSGKLLVADGTSYEEVALSGDATLASNGALTIANDAVEQAMIADDAVGADQLASSAVVNASVVDGAIKADKLDLDGSTDIGADLVDADLMIVDDGAGGTNRVAALSRIKKYVYSAMSGDATASDAGALTIAAQSVENSMLADDAVGADELAANAVVNASVASNAAIVATKLNFNVDFGGNVQFGTQTDDTVAFGGPIKVGGNAVADSGGSAAITFDGSQNTAFAGAVTAGSGYGSGGYTLTTGGALSAAGDMIIGTAGNSNGADFTAHGDATGEKAFYSAANNVFQVTGSATGLQVSIGGDLASEYAVDVVNGSNNNNKIRAAAFVTYSDESLKSDVASMSNTALDTVMSLEGVEFTWKDSGERDFGFIAQDVQSVLPNAVHTADDGVQGVDYSRLTSVLVEAVKAQQVQIDDLKKVITNLKK
jgi:hypothetical protein